MKKIILLFIGLSACVTRPVISTPPATCASLIPDTWAVGVDAAPVPDNAPVTLGQPLTAATAAAITAPWANGYVAMSGALDKANGRTADTISIFTTCEGLANAARPDAKR